MSRVALSQNNENYTETEAQDKLKHLVKDYLVNKEREKEFKDAASIQNTQIKVIMSELNIKEFETDNGKVHITFPNHGVQPLCSKEVVIHGEEYASFPCKMFLHFLNIWHNLPDDKDVKMGTLDINLLAYRLIL